MEQASRKLGRPDLLEAFGELFGFPATIERAEDLMVELQQGYREIWSYFKGRDEGPVYMLQQPDSEAWFRNRIKPLYEYDRRDLVWVVYEEFPFVLSFILTIAGHERLPANVLGEAEKIGGQPRLWTGRYTRILSLFKQEQVRGLLPATRNLIGEIEELSKPRRSI